MSTATATRQAPAGDDIFKLEKHADGIVVLRFGVPGASQNTIKADFADAFDDVLEKLEHDTEVIGVVLISDKPGSFMAGADIGLFNGVKSASEVEALSLAAQAGFKRLSRLHVPVVAAIAGSCLGGGLEMALACDVRIAADTPATTLGVPEVMLGLLPAAGGTQRLPRLVGIQSALDLMLTGRKLRPAQAKKLGLVDGVVAPEALLDEAIRQARSAGKRSLTSSASVIGRARERVGAGVAGLTTAALEDTTPGRRVLFDQARKQLQSKTKGHYPAPERIIDVVATGYAKGVKAGYAAEAKAFGDLAMSEVSKSLRHVYHATEALKKATFVAKNVKPREVRQIGVLGAGLMGAGIATVTIDKAGLPVRLKDVSDDGLARGMQHVNAFYAKRVAKKAMTRAQADRCLHQVTGTTNYSGIGACDIVIEAVFEDLELKQQMLADVEAAADARGNTDCIFATNTSSLPISEIAAKAKRPENVIGLHYFSPVEKMPLLEIIATEKTAKKTIATAVAFGKAQGKTVIVVADGPGFYTTRALSPYLNEAARLLAEGAGVRQIDEALVNHGFPVGPMTLLDEVGVDVGVKVGPILEAAFGERMAAPNASAKMIEAGHLGRKSGKGFYDYTAPKKKGEKRPINADLDTLLAGERDGGRAPDDAEIVERCTLLFANEAAHCLSEKIIREPMHGDIGAIFGLGFLPFTGGPFRYIDTMGVALFVDRLDALAEKHGPRFEPAPILKTMAKATSESHRGFYP
ncbi:fatty acid oxidation complex subunit alpha FadJ [Endozoicomonas sp. G2_2]|uniref:fatty acid oxidation complex subunit alpha FadJ n=1 Tax=Endozoicomonas sp. G2_2 TaxID=2821092 RepID=UPI001ADBAB03|nr:fatty acid oxidation complex subunit alpha FadJ [Endozoicomonas sp. G2_2]MBO9469769.1 fatty acid oxidation complex subunit alpha FadJ [Endozoicomonas sp. G2_2]